MAGSRNDVWGEFVIEYRNLIFEVEFLFFQPPQAKLIGAPAFLQGVDSFIQIAMFAKQHSKLNAQNFPVVHFSSNSHVGLVGPVNSLLLSK